MGIDIDIDIPCCSGVPMLLAPSCNTWRETPPPPTVGLRATMLFDGRLYWGGKHHPPSRKMGKRIHIRNNCSPQMLRTIELAIIFLRRVASSWSITYTWLGQQLLAPAVQLILVGQNVGTSPGSIYTGWAISPAHDAMSNIFCSGNTLTCSNVFNHHIYWKHFTIDRLSCGRFTRISGYLPTGIIFRNHRG